MSLYKFWLIYYELKINTCNWKYNSKKSPYYPMHPLYSVFGITRNYPFKIISFFFSTLNSIINVARVYIIHLFLQYPICLICGLQMHAATWGRHFFFFFFYNISKHWCNNVFGRHRFFWKKSLFLSPYIGWLFHILKR